MGISLYSTELCPLLQMLPRYPIMLHKYQRSGAREPLTSFLLAIGFFHLIFIIDSLYNFVVLVVLKRFSSIAEVESVNCQLI